VQVLKNHKTDSLTTLMEELNKCLADGGCNTVDSIDSSRVVPDFGYSSGKSGIRPFFKIQQSQAQPNF